MCFAFSLKFMDAISSETQSIQISEKIISFEQEWSKIGIMYDATESDFI